MRAYGFTLLELLVTLAILGVLATLAVPVAQVTVQSAREQELRLALREVRTAIDSYKKAVDQGKVVKSATASAYPRALEALVDGVPDQTDPGLKKIYFLRRIPRDPMVTDVGLSNAATWGKRSYASSASDPREGDDVFDVYSTSNTVGLNGVPYRYW